MKPDFICIGAQKAGTSWLHFQLERHPDFSMPPVKELHYFDRDERYPTPNHLAVTRRRDRMRDRARRRKMVGDIWRPARSLKLAKARWWARYHLHDFTDDWYVSLFKNQKGITGDVTPSYSLLDEADIARMQRVAPEARLILMIRNPIDRAWSMLRFHEQFGRPLDLGDLEAFKRRIEAPEQVRRSDYPGTIERVLRHYSPEQLLIGFFDAIERDPAGLLSAVCRYLGAEVPRAGTASLRRKVNESKRADPCPEHFRAYLVEKYAGMIEDLADRYGGYAEAWRRELRGEPRAYGTPVPVVFPGA